MYTRNLLKEGHSYEHIATILTLGIVIASDYFLHRRRKDKLTCAVGGFVQYGKTANMICVAAILADHGFSKVIVTSGRTQVLRNQTAGRAHQSLKPSHEDEEEEDSVETGDEEDELKGVQERPRGPETPIQPPQTPITTDEASPPLPDDSGFIEAGAGELGWKLVELLRLPEGERHVKNDFGRRALNRLRNLEKDRNFYFFVIKKHRHIIDNLLEYLVESCKKEDKIAWFDDEADETVNSKQNSQQRTLLHASCEQLLKFCHNSSVDSVYFGYSATLSACLLQDHHSIFYPKTISFMFLNQPSYLGIEHFTSPEWLGIRY